MEAERHPFSWQALTRIIVAGLLVFLVWKSISIFVVILIALVIAAALYPLAQKMHAKKVPMIIAIMMVIILLLIPIAVLITITSLTFAKQFPEMISALTPVLTKFHLTSAALKNINIASYVQSNLGSFLASTKQVALAVIAFLTTIFLAFYFMFDAKNLFKMFTELFPKRHRKNVEGLFEEISLVTGQYIRGNLLISLICILVIYGGLVALRIPFALPIAIFTGIMDLLPVIGPILGAIPALVLGFASSPVTGVLVLVLYVVYKEVEDVVLSPAIYNKALNLSAALVFLSVVVGAGVFGVVGAFLALPVAASIPVILRYKENIMNREALETEHSHKSN